ncbi:hypothetical protein HDU86_000576 [Geranomyces michiganensis]|nr:hypothetical protein HDU86_000576 [Geranomyces michiganensis]
MNSSTQYGMSTPDRKKMSLFSPMSGKKTMVNVSMDDYQFINVKSIIHVLTDVIHRRPDIIDIINRENQVGIELDSQRVIDTYATLLSEKFRPVNSSTSDTPTKISDVRYDHLTDLERAFNAIVDKHPDVGLTKNMLRAEAEKNDGKIKTSVLQNIIRNVISSVCYVRSTIVSKDRSHLSSETIKIYVDEHDIIETYILPTIHKEPFKESIRKLRINSPTISAACYRYDVANRIKDKVVAYSKELTTGEERNNAPSTPLPAKYN